VMAESCQQALQQYSKACICHLLKAVYDVSICQKLVQAGTLVATPPASIARHGPATRQVW